MDTDCRLSVESLGGARMLLSPSLLSCSLALSLSLFFFFFFYRGVRGKTPPRREAHPFERGSLSGRAPSARFKREDLELVEGTFVFPFPCAWRHKRRKECT